MRKLLTIALAASLTACSAATHQSIATASTKAVIAGDESYRAASQFGAALVASGKLNKPTFQDLDRKAYAALIVLRSAQAGGTAADVTTATTNLGIAVAAIYALKGQ